ncbi:MAG: A24 family peptidase, partial [candidate division Zixibacteria bacterium]|nr:A24 family peptidase [candidate division Zixibacteria bacterium]
KGRCRHCQAAISPRYLFVELASGLIWLGLFGRFGLSPVFVIAVIYLSILFAVSVTDFETGFIPDRLTVPGIAAGILASALVPGLHGEVLWYRGLMHSAAGLLAGGGLLWVVGAAGNLIFRKESMGGGDIKLIAMMGAFLGLEKVILVFLFAPVAALPFALYVKFFQKKETIVFGPFLAAAGAFLFLFGGRIVSFFFL